MLKRLFINEKFILFLILLNSVILFVGDYITTYAYKHALHVADNIVTILFIVELLVKLKMFGFKGYFQSKWNQFDFVLIIVSIPALAAYIFNIDMADYSYLLVFRILRVFKVLRLVRFVPNIEELLAGIRRALRASIFVLFGFVIYIFVIGIISFYAFQDSGSSYYSDPLASLYSTFKIFTVEGWFEIPEQVIKDYSETKAFFTYLFFVFVVLTGGIFGLSLVNSIFVDSMLSDNNDELENKIDELDSKISEVLTKLNQNETREDP